MTIQRQAAVLFASDLPKTITFWNDQLGFAAHATFLDPPVFAIMERDRHYVMLKQLAAGDSIKPYTERGGRGAPIDYGLYDQPYGVREFAVRDPGKQTIGFGQVLGTPNGAPPA